MDEYVESPLLLGKAMRKVATGSTAEIYIFEVGEESFIVKVFTTPESKNLIRNEVAIQNAAHRLGVAPKVISYSDNYIIMDYVKGSTLTEHSPKKSPNAIVEAFKKLYDNGIDYPDKTSDNVMITPEGEVVIIDFGLCTMGTSPIPEDHRNYGIVYIPSKRKMEIIRLKQREEMEERRKKRLAELQSKKKKATP